MDEPRVRWCVSRWAALVGVVLLLPPAPVAAFPDGLDLLRRRAKEYAEKGQWDAAHDLYVRIPPADRTDDDRDGYQNALRHARQSERLRDRAARVLLDRLLPAQAVNIYRDVLETLQSRYVDRGKVTLAQLFRNGALELARALDNEDFQRDHFADARSEAVQAFKDRLDAARDGRPSPVNLREAREQFHAVLTAAQPLRLRPGTVLLEFVCGACHSLDEYTLYLGPRQFLDAEAEREGRVVGIGVEVAALDQRLVLARVYRNSPAEAAELRAGDVLLSIDGQPVDPSLPQAAAARLAGEDGSVVEMEVLRMMSAGMMLMTKRTLSLERRPVLVPSVDVGEEWKDGVREHTGIGLIKLTSFQKTTALELKEAIFDLRARMGDAGLKALVIDLRGNAGGSFAAALQVAELFLQQGVIVTTQGRAREAAHRANNPSAFTMPLVVLTDGDTASAAEVVAGALKERGRATLVGQTTFGKCSVQDVFRLESLKAGLQVTVAHFTSPAQAARDGRGVSPHHFVERGSLAMADPQRDAAFQVADQQARMVPR